MVMIHLQFFPPCFSKKRTFHSTSSGIHSGRKIHSGGKMVQFYFISKTKGKKFYQANELVRNFSISWIWIQSNLLHELILESDVSLHQVYQDWTRDGRGWEWIFSRGSIQVQSCLEVGLNVFQSVQRTKEREREKGEETKEKKRGRFATNHFLPVFSQ